jgi:hypothetical protein
MRLQALLRCASGSKPSQREKRQKSTTESGFQPFLALNWSYVGSIPYSDVMFGLLRLLGYCFSPRLADVGGTRFWRIDADADYGLFNHIARQKVNLALIAQYWDDLLRLAGSLKLGKSSPASIRAIVEICQEAVFILNLLS